MNPSSTTPSEPRKAVLVTGAAKCIGREIAIHFGRQGWDVAVHYGRSEKEAQDTVAQIRAFGVNAEAFQADLASEQAVQDLFSQVSQQFLNLHSLVNSASIFEYDRANSEAPLSSKRLVEHMRVNLTAPILLAQQMFEFHKEIK